RTDIDADNAAARAARLQPFFGSRVTLIVETEAVDHRLIFGQPEDTRLGIARLRQRRDRADLGEAEAEPEQSVRHFGVLVIAGRHAERIGEVEPAQRDTKPRVTASRRRAAEAGAQREYRQSVRVFGIEGKKRPPADHLERVHAPRSGKTWRPSAPSGRGRTHFTALSCKGA